MQTPKLEGQVVSTADLSATDRERMFQLMIRHYEGVDWDAFQADLAEKQWVLRLVDAKTGNLSGFSTQMLFPVHVSGRQILAVYSGDTIVDREKWGSPALGLAALKLAFSLIDQHPNQDLYWFLISKGYKTYRFLPVYFREFFPRFDRPTPDWASEIMHACARQRFGDAYDAQAGVVVAEPGGCRLREGVADITEQRKRDPHVQFFLTRNPGYAQGNELCCIAALKHENFASTARRWVDPESLSRMGSE